MNVFFIDNDHAMNRYHEIILAETAGRQNVSLSFSDNPIQALKLLGDEDPFPCVIFLDINMPLMDGWEFLETYGQSDFPQDVAIVILTTSRNPEYKERADQIDLVAAYKTKPMDVGYFEEIVGTYCRGER
ncbi:MAG: response regulator [Bacteroidota bacterium]